MDDKEYGAHVGASCADVVQYLLTYSSWQKKCVTAVILSEVFILFIFLVFDLDNARSLLSVLH